MPIFPPGVYGLLSHLFKAQAAHAKCAGDEANSLCSRRLEVMRAKKRGHAREIAKALPLSLCVSLSRAPFFPTPMTSKRLLRRLRGQQIFYLKITAIADFPLVQHHRISNKKVFYIKPAIAHSNKKSMIKVGFVVNLPCFLTH